MPYSGTMSTGDWQFIASKLSGVLVTNLEQAKDLFDKWYAFGYGKTDQQIADALSTDLDTVQKITACFQAMKELNDALTNVAVSTADRRSSLIHFI